MLWTPIASWSDLIEHVGGTQYASRLFAAPLAGVAHKMRAFALGLPAEITWPALLLAVVGFVSLFRRVRRVAFVLLGWSVLVLAHAAVYKIPDIEVYFEATPLILGLEFANRTFGWLMQAPLWQRLARAPSSSCRRVRRPTCGPA